MTTYISILRGINVGGYRMIKMDALKKLYSELNFTEIQSYLQSGNLVFKSFQTDTELISETIKMAIQKEFNFNVPVVILTQKALESIIVSNPFIKNTQISHSFLHVTFLSVSPSKQQIEQLTGVDFKNDQFKIIERIIYLYCPDGYNNSKLTNSFFENKFKTTATTRKWRTTNELLKLTIK